MPLTPQRPTKGNKICPKPRPSARWADAQDGSPVPVSPTDRGRGVLASQYRANGRNLSDTTSDRGSGQIWLDKVSGVSEALAQRWDCGSPLAHER